MFEAGAGLHVVLLCLLVATVLSTHIAVVKPDLPLAVSLLHEVTPHIPLILFVQPADKESAIGCLEAGAENYMLIQRNKSGDALPSVKTQFSFITGCQIVPNACASSNNRRNILLFQDPGC